MSFVFSLFTWPVIPTQGVEMSLAPSILTGQLTDSDETMILCHGQRVARQGWRGIESIFKPPGNKYENWPIN